MNICLSLQFVQQAIEFLLPKLRQKYTLWFCCDGYYNKQQQQQGNDSSGGGGGDSNEKKDDDGSASLYDDLNIQELEAGDPRINQVSGRMLWIIHGISLHDFNHRFTEHPRECKGRVQHLR